MISLDGFGAGPNSSRKVGEVAERKSAGEEDDDDDDDTDADDGREVVVSGNDEDDDDDTDADDGREVVVSGNDEDDDDDKDVVNDDDVKASSKRRRRAGGLSSSTPEEGCSRTGNPSQMPDKSRPNKKSTQEAISALRSNGTMTQTIS